MVALALTVDDQNVWPNGGRTLTDDKGQKSHKVSVKKTEKKKYQFRNNSNDYKNVGAAVFCHVDAYGKRPRDNSQMLDAMSLTRSDPDSPFYNCEVNSKLAAEFLKMATFHPGYLASKYAKAKTPEARAAIKSEYLASKLKKKPAASPDKKKPAAAEKKQNNGMFTPRSPGKCHASIDATPAASKEGASDAQQLTAILTKVFRDIDYKNDIGTVTSKLQRLFTDNHKLMQLYYGLLDGWEKQHVGQRLNAGEFMQELLKTSFAEARLKNEASVTIELRHANVVAPMKKAAAEKKSGGGTFAPTLKAAVPEIDVTSALAKELQYEEYKLDATFACEEELTSSQVLYGLHGLSGEHPDVMKRTLSQKDADKQFTVTAVRLLHIVYIYGGYGNGSLETITNWVQENSDICDAACKDIEKNIETPEWCCTNPTCNKQKKNYVCPEFWKECVNCHQASPLLIGKPYRPCEI